MKTTLFLAFWSAFTCVFAVPLQPTIQAPAANHLTEINKQWKLYPEYIPLQNIRFKNDRERITFHLSKVVQLLRQNTSAALNADQLAKRHEMISILQQYANVGIFPINAWHSVRQPYFIDQYGTHCAVGYLLKMSGHGNIALDISRRQNYAYVHEIQSAELVNWSKTFGFTLHELALIQPAYPPTQSYQQVGGGTNGTVKILTAGQMNNLIIAGEFTMLNDQPCLNIGRYYDNQLSCYGTGIEGKIVAAEQNGSTVIAAGKLISGGVTYPLATFNGTSWTFVEIPGRPGAEATAMSAVYSGMEIAINHPTDPSRQEIWAMQQNNWTLKGEVQGKIYVMDRQYTYAYAGKFDAITLAGITYSTNNVIIRNQYNGTWETVQDNVSDTIFSIASDGSAVFLGGSPASGNICISRYLNGVMQPLLLTDYVTPSGSVCIKNMEIDGSDLIVTGDFTANSMTVIGRHIARFSQSSGMLIPMSVFDDAVNAVAKVSGKWYFGGEFTTAGNQSFNHLVKLASSADVEEIPGAEWSVYPNPSGGMIHIQGGQLKSVTIADLQGKQWIEASPNLGQIDATSLPAGAYLIHIQAENGSVATHKWIKI